MSENLDEQEVAEEAQVTEAPARLTPGALLRAAREEKGVSVADVAQVIRFSPRQIDALEADDYAALPGATAVRGFVRSYAKFLKLDPAPLLADLDPAVPAPEADVRPPTNMGEAEQPSFSDRVPPRFIATAFGLLLVALAAFWFFTRPSPPEKAGEPLAVQSPAVVSAPQPVAIATPPATPVSEPAPAQPAEAVAAPAPAAVAPPATVASTSGLRVEFDDRSWIEVRDATQKVVFVGEYSAGTKQNVEGKAPFQIWIGKASGVRVSMAGRAIDLKPHTREEVARLTVE